MPHDIRAIANFILDQSDRMGFPITNMALNKILYFTHGWRLAFNHGPLYAQEFEAWPNGPVSPVIYHEFKQNRSEPIGNRAKIMDIVTGESCIARYHLTEEEVAFIVRMISFYGHREALTLSHMSHEKDAPWDIVRNSGTQLGMRIPNTDIQEYFATKLKSKAHVKNGREDSLQRTEQQSHYS